MCHHCPATVGFNIHFHPSTSISPGDQLLTLQREASTPTSPQAPPQPASADSTVPAMGSSPWLSLQPLAREDIQYSRETNLVLILQDCNRLSVTFLTMAEAPAKQEGIRGLARFPAALDTCALSTLVSLHTAPKPTSLSCPTHTTALNNLPRSAAKHSLLLAHAFGEPGLWEV